MKINEKTSMNWHGLNGKYIPAIVQDAVRGSVISWVT